MLLPCHVVVVPTATRGTCAGDRLPYGQIVTNTHLHRMWAEAAATAEFQRRRTEVDAFNAANRYKKRGLSMMPVCYGINFGCFMDQGAALVMVYIDGSVLVTHGGVEMGQGLHTKMQQVAAQTLGVPVSLIHVEETATDKVSGVRVRHLVP